MPVLLAKSTARLTGTVTVEEVETLAGWIRENRSATVSLDGCEHLHAAALQLLLVSEIKISRPPRDPFLATWVHPLLSLTGPAAPEPTENPMPEEAGE